MKIVKDTGPGAWAVRVACIGPDHQGNRMFTLAEGYADLDGKPFEAYYCAECVPKQPSTPDLVFRSEGSGIFLLEAATEAGRAWISEYIPEDAMTFAGAIVVEHRYVQDIVEGAMNDGLTVERR